MHNGRMSQILYDAAFYDANEAGSYRSAKVVLGLAVPLLKPNSILDVGCGVGTWLRAAQDLGVEHLMGIDGAYVDLARLHVDPKCFTPADLAEPKSLDAALGGRWFDLTMCLEVAEHVPTSAARGLVVALAATTDIVLWGAAVPGQGGTNHVNERPLTYWSSLWCDAGFEPLDVLRPGLQFANIDVWYAQNPVIFARPEKCATVDELFSAFYKSKFGHVPPLSYIHPAATSPWRGLDVRAFSDLLDGFAQKFQNFLANALGIAQQSVVRHNIIWDGHLSMVGFSPPGGKGVQPQVMVFSPHRTMLYVGLHFPCWSASEQDVASACARATNAGLDWDDPLGPTLEGWARLSEPRVSLRLELSLLEGEPDDAAAAASAVDVAGLWTAYQDAAVD